MTNEVDALWRLRAAAEEYRDALAGRDELSRRPAPVEKRRVERAIENARARVRTRILAAHAAGATPEEIRVAALRDRIPQLPS